MPAPETILKPAIRLDQVESVPELLQQLNVIFERLQNGGVPQAGLRPQIYTVAPADAPTANRPTMVLVDSGDGPQLQVWSGSAWVDMSTTGQPGPHTIVGTQHTATGLSVGQVIRATAATTFAWAALLFSDLSGTIADGQVLVGAVTQHIASIDHDALLNFVANEHVDWTSTSSTFSTSGTVATGALTVTGNTTFNSLPYTWPVATGTNGQLLSWTTGDVLDWIDAPSTGIGGSGTIGTIPIFVTDTTTIGNSIITEIGGVITVTGGLTITSTVHMGSTLVFDVAGDNLIRTNTSDASDNARLIMAGGGAGIVARGAAMLLGGNEHGINPGQVAFFAGDVAGGHIKFTTGNNVLQFQIDGPSGNADFQSNNLLNIGTSAGMFVGTDQTGIAVTAAGIHAALVSLGAITA